MSCFLIVGTKCPTKVTWGKRVYLGSNLAPITYQGGAGMAGGERGSRLHCALSQEAGQ